MKKHRLNLMTLLIFIITILFIIFGSIFIDNLFKIFTYIITIG